MGARCRPLLRDPIARHFSIKAMEIVTLTPTLTLTLTLTLTMKAMEILRGDAEGAPHAAHHLAPGAASRVDDCALKLVFFVRAPRTAHALLTLHPLAPRTPSLRYTP